MFFWNLCADNIREIFDYLDDKDKKNLFKSLNKDIYENIIDNGIKIKLNSLSYPYQIIKSKIFYSCKIIILNAIHLDNILNIDFKNNILSLHFLKINFLNFAECMEKLSKFKNKIELLLDYDNDVYMNNLELDKIPKNVKYLHFGNNFNRNIEYIPKWIIYLSFGNNFNSYISKFPENLIYLKFGNKFNKEIYEYPKNLRYLFFGDKYNQDLYNLPEKICRIDFGNSFNRNIDKLSDNVENLKLGKYFDKLITKFPIKLKTLKINKYNEKKYKKINHQNFKIVYYNDEKIEN